MNLLVLSFKEYEQLIKKRITKNHQKAQQIQPEEAQCLDQFPSVFGRAKYAVQVCELHNEPILSIAEYPNFSIPFN
jgi:hypothetical protein